MNSEINFITHLRGMMKKMLKILENKITPYGISHAEMRLLILLYGDDGCTQDELSAKVEVDRSNVGRALKKLENLNYIKRERSENDKRSFSVFLTKKALDIKNEILNIKSKIDQMILKSLNNEEIETLTTLLKKINDSIE